MSHHDQNRWKGFVLGAIGGIAGTVAIDYYWKAVTLLTGSDPRQAQKKGGSQPGSLDSISFVGKQYEEGESSTAAVGRLLYRLFTGKEPRSKETKTTLSYLVHWTFGMFMGGLYGAIRRRTGLVDVPGGVMFGTAVWLFGDELTVPLMGLAGGPTAYPVEIHAHGWGAHIAYGLATFTTTQLLHRVTGSD